MVDTTKKLGSSLPASDAPSSNRLSDAPSLQPSSDHPDDGLESLRALEDMVDPDCLSVVFQPIIIMETGEIYANEVLVRCSDPKLSPPPVLFEKAVASGCVGRLGRIIREIAVPHAGHGRLFVNIHPNELSESWLVRPDDPIYIHDAEIFLEITESAPLTHLELCMSVLKDVASRVGVHLVIDDLGAGYSNLLRIAELEPSVVKLDRQLVMDLDKSPRKRELVAGVVDLCRRLGATVVAEGVETLDEYLALMDTGAQFGQGYLFARPGFPLPKVKWPPRSPEDATTIAPPTLPST